MRRHFWKITYVTFLTGLLYTYATILGGCGGDLALHAAAADATRTVNKTAVALIETNCRTAAVEAASNSAVTVDEAEANAADVTARCTVIKDAQHLFAEALDVWVSVLVIAVANDDFDVAAAAPLVLDVIRLYEVLPPLVAHFGWTLPEVPVLVLKLLGDGR